MIRQTVFQYGGQRGEGKDRSGKETGGTAGTDKAFNATTVSEVGEMGAKRRTGFPTR